MALDKHIEASCDYCDANIGYYPGSNKALALELAKDDGAISVNGRLYCNKDCQLQHRKQGNQ